MPRISSGRLGRDDDDDIINGWVAVDDDMVDLLSMPKASGRKIEETENETPNAGVGATNGSDDDKADDSDSESESGKMAFPPRNATLGTLKAVKTRNRCIQQEWLKKMRHLSVVVSLSFFKHKPREFVCV
jgi:hypothetical protein